MTKRVTTDVDIDVSNRDEVLEGLDYVAGTIIRDGIAEKHNTGVYFQPIPKDPFTNRALLDHKDAENNGYFKIDLLNVSLYNNIQSQDHLKELLATPPNWELLMDELFVHQLFHIGGHYHLVRKLSPTTVEQLAAVLAIIRPGKRYLEDKPWDVILNKVWIKEKGSKYVFKRSHALAYSLAIVVQMNLLVEELSEE